MAYGVLVEELAREIKGAEASLYVAKEWLYYV